jgi:vacuolar-type H+-ATPase subunit C/Vma6
MNPGLRHAFAPLFGLFEIKTMVLCLRNSTVRRTSEIHRLLAHSLLDRRIQEILVQPADVRTIVAALASAVAEDEPMSRQLEKVHEEGGLKAFEDGLMRLYLQETLAGPLVPAVRTFFVWFTDLRNVMLLYKHLRWDVPPDRAQFVTGGRVEPSRLQEIVARKDRSALDDLVARMAGLDSMPIATGEGSLETVLLTRMTIWLDRARRRGDELASVVAYVWRTYVQARNLAVLYHASDLDPQTLEQELVV